MAKRCHVTNIIQLLSYVITFICFHEKSTSTNSLNNSTVCLNMRNFAQEVKAIECSSSRRDIINYRSDIKEVIYCELATTEALPQTDSAPRLQKYHPGQVLLS